MVERIAGKIELLLNGCEGWKPDEEVQHSSILFLLELSALTLALFSVVNYINGHQWLGIVQLLTFFAFIPLFYTRINRMWLRYSREIFLGLALFSFMALIIDGGIGNTGIYWALTYPFFVFLLMGVKRGWRWIVCFVLLYAVLLLLHNQGLVHMHYSHETFIYTPGMFLFFSIIACTLQLQQERQQLKLNAANSDLREREQALLSSSSELENTVRLRTEQLIDINKKLSREVNEKSRVIEKQKFTEMKYLHAQKMEALGTLVGGIAHDFNNMLAGMTAKIYLLQLKVETPDEKKHLEKMEELAMHASDMIHQLLTFARKEELELKVFDLRAFLKEAYKLARLSIPEDIHCEGIFSPEKQVIRGEPTQIQQVIMNLMNNARDALSGVDEPFITLSLSPCSIREPVFKNQQEILPGNYTILSVQDNGCGMSKDMIGRVFEPFYSTKEEGEGTGLGLSMVYGVVQSHGGYIDVISYPGSGTRFSIYFPLTGEKKASVREVHPVERGRGETILLVDDDLDLLEANRQLLEELGYSVLTARDGVEAVEIFQQQGDTVDLLLMDVVMPELGGLAAADAIRGIDPDASILFMSGYDVERELSGAQISDRYSLLVKPLTIDKLSHAIRESLSPQGGESGGGTS